MRTRLVLVEGFPGCGKSTTAQWIARQLVRAGRRAEWFYEEQRPHPVLGQIRTAPPTSWKELLAERLGRWWAGTTAMRASDTVAILDSAWLQFPIATMLRRDVDDRVITAFVGKTVETMRDLDPALVYLSQPSPEDGMRRLFESRGMAWALLHVAGAETSAFARSRGLSGLDALLRYWREHNTLAEALAADAGMPTLTVDPRHGDWPARRRSIARFLDLSDDATVPAGAGNPARFVGTYEGGGIRFSIALRDGVPVLDGLLWLHNRLLPVAPNVVEAESWPFVLTFQEGADGTIAGVRIDGPVVPSLKRVAGDYDRTG